jgi:GT2 family glycosyltransferase
VTPMPSLSVPAFDVIIPVRGQHRLANAAIDSVLDGNAEEVSQLIVIDDASPSELGPSISPEVRRSIDLRLLRNERRAGFLAATERAVAASTAPLVLVLNSDARLVPGLLREARRTASDWDVLGFVAANAGEFSLPFTRPRTRDRLLARHHKPITSDRNCVERVLHQWIDENAHKVTVPTSHFHGFCFAYVRTFIDGIGGLRGDSPASGRRFESELSKRVLEAGGKVAVHLGHVLEHQGSASTSALRRTTDLLAAAWILRRRRERHVPHGYQGVPAEILELRRRLCEAGC